MALPRLGEFAISPVKVPERNEQKAKFPDAATLPRDLPVSGLRRPLPANSTAPRISPHKDKTADSSSVSSSRQPDVWLVQQQSS